MFLGGEQSLEKQERNVEGCGSYTRMVPYGRNLLFGMKAPLRQHLGARSWSVPSLGSRCNLLGRAGRIGYAGWKVSGNRFDDWKSEPSLNCEQDSRLWSIPNAERRVTTKPSKPANPKGSGAWGAFALINVSFTKRFSESKDFALEFLYEPVMVRVLLGYPFSLLPSLSQEQLVLPYTPNLPG